MELKSFEELERLKQEGRIGWVEFLLQSEYGNELQAMARRSRCGI